MSDQNIVDNAYGTAKAVVESEPFKNLTNPPAKVLGNYLADFFTLVFGNIHYATEKAELKRKNKLNEFKNNILKGTENIPEENKTEPRDSIICQALDASKYFMNEDDIREMFENLIIKSMDNRMASNIHPSYTEIIKQMSPLDAQNLKLFFTQNQFPVCQLRKTSSDGTFGIIATNYFYSNPECDDMVQQSISISSLERIGLISISYDSHISDDSVYAPFELLEEYRKLKQEIETMNSFTMGNDKLTIKKGLAIITPLGKAFIDVCLRPLPKKSSP